MKKLKQFSVLLSLCIAACFLFACTENSLSDNGNKQDENKREQEVIAYNLAFAGDYNQEELPFGDKYATSTIESDLKIKVDSLSQLISISNENEFPFFDENDENYNNAFSKKIREYDEEFFTDKSLILIFSFGTNNLTVRITGTNLQGTTLTVTGSKPDGIYETDVKRSFAYIIEMEKSDVKNVEKIELQLESAGAFYTLEDGFEKAYLNEADVKSIVYYYKDGKGYGEDFVPQPKVPQEIDKETDMKIKDSILAYYYSSGYPLDPNGTLYKTLLNSRYSYLGTYNGYVAVSFDGIIAGLPVRTITVAGETYRTEALGILLWKGTNDFETIKA